LKSGHIWQRFREQDKVIGLRGSGIFRKPPTQESCVGRCHPLLDETLGFGDKTEQKCFAA